MAVSVKKLLKVLAVSEIFCNFALENLENLDDYIRNSSRWTTRNAELNRAVEMYVDYMNAREDLKCHYSG